MKPFYAAALLLLLALTITAQNGRTSDSNKPASDKNDDAPKLVIESFTHDFGEVKSGTALRYAFKIKNEGKRDLLINNVAPS